MTTSKTNSKSSGSSKESLGKVAALLLTSAMMVGTGIYTTLGAATSKAHSGILIAMLIGVLIVLLTAISAAQVGVNYSEEGGAFIWMRIFGYPTISFAAGISYLIKGMVGLGIPSLGLASYSAQIFPRLPIPIVASIALLIVAAVNFFGITPTAKVIIGIFFINLVLLILYVGFSVPSVKVTNLTPVFGSGITGIMTGAATFFWSWDGFQRTAIMADTIKNPRKSIPFAIIGGILITAVIYLIVAGTTLGVLGAYAMGQSDTPLLFAAKTAILGWGIWIILLSVAILTFSDILGDMMSTSKVGHAMGQEHELPHWLGRVHKRFKSPQFVIFLLTIVGLVLINLVPLRKLTTVASASTLVWYIATNFAALKLNKERRFAWPIISWLGIATCIALFFSLPLWSTLGTLGFIVLLTGIRWVLIRVAQKEVVDASGNWTVAGLTLAEGDLISVTAQYAGETVSTEVTTVVAEAPLQTIAPVISRTVTAADTTVSGKAPSGASVVFSVNGIAQTAVVATGGNWAVSGLSLSQGDLISVTAQSVGETVSAAATTTVVAAPLETVEPVISARVTAADTAVSGRAPSGASVVLSVNGKAQPPVVATNGNWTVSGLSLSQGDLISVTAQHADETVNTATITTVTTTPLQTAEPVVYGIVTAADTTVSGRAPSGASVVLSVNGKAQPAVIATSGRMVGAATTTTVAATPLQTVAPVISGRVTAADTTVSGRAPSGASIVLSVNGVAKPAVIASGGSWIVSGLSLAQNDFISVAAQSAGEAMSTPVTMIVEPAPQQTAVPVISGIITAADTTVSGKAPAGASVVLSINGKAQPLVVATNGNWTVPGLTLAQGDSISVTAQSAGEVVSIAATTTVAAAQLQTADPMISGIITAADTTVSGKAPAGTSVVLSINGKAQPAVVAIGGNWTVPGLTLVQGDSISVTAQSAGEAMSTPVTMIVEPAPQQTAVPVISGIITAADTSVSGRAPSGASVVLSINGKAQPAVVVINENWTVSGLTLAQGDSISVTAQYAGEAVSTAATTTVVAAPLQTAGPMISGIVTAADTTVSGRALSGANVVLSINGKAQPAVVAIGGNWAVSGLTLAQGDSISVTAQSANEAVSTAATIEVQ